MNQLIEHFDNRHCLLQRQRLSLVAELETQLDCLEIAPPIQWRPTIKINRDDKNDSFCLKSQIKELTVEFTGGYSFEAKNVDETLGRQTRSMSVAFKFNGEESLMIAISLRKVVDE